MAKKNVAHYMTSYKVNPITDSNKNCSKVMLMHNGIEPTVPASAVDHAGDEKALQQHWEWTENIHYV